MTLIPPMRGMPVDGCVTDGATALLIAAASGHVDMLKLLIERRANARLPDDHGGSGLVQMFGRLRQAEIENLGTWLAG